MESLFTNWKTSSAGIGALIMVAFKFYTTHQIGAEDITAVLVGFGLLAAKDLNVTGGTKEQ